MHLEIDGILINNPRDITEEFAKYCDGMPESHIGELNSETSFPRQRAEAFPL
jgi:hypothetical protein